MGDDHINRPRHYTMGNIEVMDAIQSWGLNYAEGNIVKYVARYKHKHKKSKKLQLEDLQKAQWYLNRLIVELGNGK